MASILLIEDDTSIRMTVEIALGEEGYRVVSSNNGEDGLKLALALEPDLILLDLMLPGIDGREVLTSFRSQNTRTPVIVLTALSGDQDKIFCLDSGADDYVCKPFSIDELLARIRVNLRKAAPTAGQAPLPSSRILQFGDLAIDLDKESVTVKDEPLYLKRKQYELLAALAEHEGTLVKRKWLVNRVWGKDVSPTTNTIDVHIYGLRKALDERSDYEFITTEYGRGYRFGAIPKAAQANE